MMMILAGAIDRYHDPIFDLNVIELVLGIIVIAVICYFIGWAWRTFKP